MPHVEFSEDEAGELLRQFRARVISNGLVSADESAIAALSGLGDHGPVKTNRKRLQRYFDAVLDWVSSHSASSVDRAIDNLNSHLSDGSVEKVVLRMPEESTDRNRRDVPLHEFLIPDEVAEAFLMAIKPVRSLVYESRLPGPDLGPRGPDGPDETPRGPADFTPEM
jgi:hypothetical protein